MAQLINFKLFCLARTVMAPVVFFTLLLNNLSALPGIINTVTVLSDTLKFSEDAWVDSTDYHVRMSFTASQTGYYLFKVKNFGYSDYWCLNYIGTNSLFEMQNLKSQVSNYNSSKKIGFYAASAGEQHYFHFLLTGGNGTITPVRNISITPDVCYDVSVLSNQLFRFSNWEIEQGSVEIENSTSNLERVRASNFSSIQANFKLGTVFKIITEGLNNLRRTRYDFKFN